jgi:integrase/recombinase XerC
MLIEKFLDYLQLEKNYSSNTLSAYKRDLIQYNNFIIENNGNLKLKMLTIRL